LDRFINETSNALTGMAQSIADVRRLSANSLQVAERVRGEAQIAGSAIKRSLAGVDLIGATTDEGAAAAMRLRGRIDEIGAIVRVIQEVAQQTNLLSLNAAIVAARAGEQGHGFSVVASEIKALAERTSESTEQVEALVASIEQESTRASDLMRTGI